MTDEVSANFFSQGSRLTTCQNGSPARCGGRALKGEDGLGTLHFDESFDCGIWPGPFGAKATAGELWLGVSGLIGTLEGQVGLSHSTVGSAARIGEVVCALRQTEGFWSPSFAADALATAQELIRLHDTLRLQGWTGQVDSPRLTALHAAFKGVSESAADRLERLAPAIQRTKDVRLNVRLHEDASCSPRRVREVLEALGTPVTAPLLPEVDFPSLTRRLQLIRPYGPLVAADVVAQALAASRSEPTLIIGSDSVLDAALRRHGLPTTGASSSAHDNALGEVLPLVIELGLSPADPSRAMELLTLPVGPIRRDVARKLVRALQEWPAVGSIAWLKSLAEATAEFTAEEREKLKERLASFMTATVDGKTGYPVEQLNQRCAALLQWLQGKLANEDSEQAQRQLGAAIAQVAAFSDLVAMTAAAALSVAQVRRFLEQAREAMPTPPSWSAEAGLFSVGQPGGVLGKAPRLVWWNFTRSSFVVPRRLPLSAEEFATLAAAGIQVPGPSALALRLMTRARRPLQHGGGALWLICPQHEPNGDAASPHPLWDEALGALDKAALALVRPEPLLAKPPKAVRRKALPLPGPLRDWPTSMAISRREVESPSSVEALLGCSLHWALHYVARLRSGTTAAIDTSQRMLGKLAHHILLERVLREAHASPEAAGRFAVAVLKAEGPNLAAPLFQSGADAELIAVTEATRRAAEVLQARVDKGWPVLMTEQTQEGQAFGTKFSGGLDLVLGKKAKAVIVDLKWSGAPYRRSSLEKGSAIQLASYAELLLQSGFKEPAVAYFIIQSQTWLSTSAKAAAEDTRVADPQVDTWELTTKAHAAAWKAVSKGALSAPGTQANSAEQTTVEEGELQVAPPCGFCDFSGICGRRYGVLEVEEDGEG